MNPADKDRMLARYMRGARKQVQREQNLREKKRRLMQRGRRGLGEELAPEARPEAGTERALVLSLAPGRASLWCGGAVRDARLDPELARRQKSAIAVGDEVQCAPAGDGSLVVHGIEPRRTSLSRPDPSNPHRQRVLVANVDVGVIVLSVRRPPLKPALIDRFLVALEYGGVRPVLCINKLDLADGDADELRRVDECLQPYRAIGVPTVLTSALSGTGLDELRAELRGQTAALVGHSGVGKSALLNGLDPDGARAVGAGREFDGKGRHTTTAATLTELADGTRLIDTAGVRQFGLWGMSARELQLCFSEFEAPAAACRFDDCAHDREPDCGVRAAVDRGEVAARRHAAYLRLRAELA